MIGCDNSDVSDLLVFHIRFFKIGWAMSGNKRYVEFPSNSFEYSMKTGFDQRMKVFKVKFAFAIR